ncbi:MAG: hypothetical protein AAB489_02855 [Patescibacteria group bacterium]
MRRLLLRSVMLAAVPLLSFSEQLRAASFADPIDALSVGFLGE